ncbi:3-keto-disaccharide hydrolase [Oleiharenicola lentus]|uniref:3-keto-disaccharide hydrolase n=1 Tax=Oleiharenicola lentus TaxID=2508720 RepID=UPI003F663346
MRFLTLVAVLLFALFTSFAAAPAIPQLAQSDFAGWEFIATPATEISTVCAFTSDGIVRAAGKPTGYLATKDTFENYRLHAEWRWPEKPGNGGVLVHITSGPKDRAWPECFQIQTKHQSTGDLLPMAGATFVEPLTSAPGTSPQIRARLAADSEKPAGQWNTCDIVCRGDTIEVSINGVAQNKVTGTSSRRGKIGFQFEGATFELRNITIESIK